jgi:hypothetical protein
MVNFIATPESVGMANYEELLCPKEWNSAKALLS